MLIHFVQAITAVNNWSVEIDKGAAIITVDPRFSIAASKSKYWLPIKPATDIALLLSWIHVLIFAEAFPLLEQVNSGIQYFSPDQIADMIITEDPSFLLIDVMSQNEYEEFHLPGAVNIPLPDLLSDEWKPYLNQDIRHNIFYSNSTVKANEAWMITIHLGYRNNFVPQGGLNYWVETIMNPEAPEATNPNEEIAKYNFRKKRPE